MCSEILIPLLFGGIVLFTPRFAMSLVATGVCLAADAGGGGYLALALVRSIVCKCDLNNKLMSYY